MTLAQQLAEALDEARGGKGRLLYYIGKRPAQPKPKVIGRWADRGQPEPDWVRPWLEASVQKAVFLTPSPKTVAWHHGIDGHVYAYRVPEWVIREAGGLHRYDKATEIVVPDVLWKHVKFEGKSMDKGAFAAMLKKGDSERAFASHDQGVFQRAARDRKR
jgi:hypothetical protein